MKKCLFLLLMAAIFAQLVSAQDVIVFRDGSNITASVREVGDTEIKYKRFDNPDGPTYTARKTDIFSIKYANGTTDDFTAVSNLQERQRDNTSYPVSPVTYDYFSRLRRNDANMADFLKKNDVVCYTQFARGERLKMVGGGFLVSGALLTFAGVGLVILGNNEMKNHSYYEIQYDNGAKSVVIGTIFVVVGPAFLLTSIPFFATGGGMKARAADEYERKYFDRRSYRTSLNFNLYSNGVGLAYRF